jgi:hypothetical protein
MPGTLVLRPREFFPDRLLTRAVLCRTPRTEPRPAGSGEAPFHAVTTLVLLCYTLLRLKHLARVAIFWDRK